jgi:DNA-binding transcriptional MerR regulator
MTEKRLKIGEVAKAVGLNPRTVRYYERCGLLKVGRTLSRYRVFEEHDVMRLKLVKQLRKLGFSVAETQQVLPILVDSLPQNKRIKALKAFLTRRLVVAKQELDELVTIHRELQARLRRLSSNRKAAKQQCCEPFCGPTTCEPAVVQITGLTQQVRKGGGGE